VITRRLARISIWGFFTVIINIKNAELLRYVVLKLLFDKIFVETDPPYLTPVPHRGKRNEPAYVRFVAATIANVKSLSIKEVARVTTNNVRTLFRI
jgi:TatD DNase family protein